MIKERSKSFKKFRNLGVTKSQKRVWETGEFLL